MPNGTNIRSSHARSGVFISYARTDGEDFAKLLRERLDSEGIPLWQDRVGMEGGRDWWLQIKEALDRVEFMVLVITPSVLNSDTVRSEWRYARQEGVCVYPVKGQPKLDFNILPHWMRRAHFYDLGTVQNGLTGPEWQKFVNDLNTSCRTQRVPFMVGDLPKGFVARPGEFDHLLNLLCNNTHQEPVAITAALKGAGGYGKTTLARALCHDRRIQDVFEDGILWVTLGQNPGDLIGRVEDLIVTLGDERPGFTTLDAAVNRLKEMIADRDILIVIDDVWDRTHLNPFMQGGARCARLITTRNFDTLPPSAEKVQVDAMQRQEATAMLVAGLNQASLNGEPLTDELAKLASRLGEWPLLLRLANSTLRSRIENDQLSPLDAVAWVHKALTKRGLTYFDASNSEERNHAVARTIGVSLDLLTGTERARFHELAIFPEDVDIPLVTLEKLWGKTGGFDDFDTEDLCRRLNGYSLLWNYDTKRQCIRLHDVTRKFLVQQQLNTLPSINAQLLDAHRPVGPSTLTCLWSQMSADEPYLWERLAYHLVNAGLIDELLATVKDWRYLVVKTLVCKSLEVEADLVTAEKIATDDGPLRTLRRNFVNSGHLLSRCAKKEDIETALYSRLQHLQELSDLTTDLNQHLKRPCVVPVIKLPDLPHPALVRTLSGHAGLVNACTVSVDGTTIVSASADQTLKVWDRRSGIERFTLSGHAGRVFGCAVSADGSMIVSASEDHTLKVWDGKTGIERFTLSGHAGAVFACAISADGTTIVSASEDEMLKVWDGKSGIERFTLSGHVGAVFGCAISADGTTIVSASDDQTLLVWDGNSGAERFMLRTHEGGVRGCAISADGTTIVSASDDQTLKVWDGRSGAELLTLSGHADWVRGCAISADGATIVSASDDQTLKVWDATTGTARLTLTGHAGLVFGCAISADGATIISASEDQVKVWDGSTTVGDLTAGGHDGVVLACAMSADGMTIVSAADDQTLKVWDGESGTERFTLSGHDGAVFGCVMSADGEMIVSTSIDGTMKVWDGKSGTERFTLNGHAGLVLGCAISADGMTIVSASEDQTLKVWDGKTGHERFTLNGHQGWVRGCAISADGGTIVSASEDQSLKVWDGRSGDELLTLSGHEDWVGGCAISADGAMIVSNSEDQTLKVWEGKNGTERFTLSGHAGVVLDCAMSADGTTIVSVSEDQTLKVWNGFTGECVSTLHVDGSLYGCACSEDGEILAAAGSGGIYFLRLLR